MDGCFEVHFNKQFKGLKLALERRSASSDINRAAGKIFLRYDEPYSRGSSKVCRL
jgi:hypothetical protein